MKKTILLLLCMVMCGCSIPDKNEYNIMSNNVTVWENENGEKSIVLSVEVLNSSRYALQFNASDFDIVDENGNIIQTMNLVKAYPPKTEKGKTTVYYGTEKLETDIEPNSKLRAIGYIENEKARIENENLFIKGTTVGGTSEATGIVENSSSNREYNNVNIAIISRKSNGEIISVMTTTIYSIKPKESVMFKARDIVEGRELGPNIASRFSNFVWCQ